MGRRAGQEARSRDRPGGQWRQGGPAEAGPVDAGTRLLVPRQPQVALEA